MPANGTTMEWASSMKRLGPLESVTAHLKERWSGKVSSSFVATITCLYNSQYGVGVVCGVNADWDTGGTVGSAASPLEQTRW